MEHSMGAAKIRNMSDFVDANDFSTHSKHMSDSTRSDYKQRLSKKFVLLQCKNSTLKVSLV